MTMTTIFIAGSIAIKNLHPLVLERIKKMVDSQYRIVVGDANGADSSIQQALLELGCTNATVFCSSGQPRNNIGRWPTRVVDSGYKDGSRAFFTAKDIKMAEEADCGLMVWDTKSTGTLSNVIELLKRKKNSVVFINKNKEFVIVKSPEHLDILITHMSPHSIQKAEEKISLSQRLHELKNEQLSMFS